MGKVAILTPSKDGEEQFSRWAEVLERTAAPLRSAGLETTGLSWTEDADWSRFDLVLPLLVWGYPRVPDRWIRRVAELEEKGAALHNPPSVLRWNARKDYLGQLAARGAPVVPTLYYEKLSPEIMEEAAERFGCDELVAKPQISSGAWQTIRWSPGKTVEGGPRGAAMIQPYLPQIERAGEVSLIYFRRRFSHAIRKVPQPGDFRVQPEYDGIITPHAPEADEFAAAERVLATVDEELLYARVDLVRGFGAMPELIELELIEPDLYLGFDPQGGRVFAEQAVELIGR